MTTDTKQRGSESDYNLGWASISRDAGKMMLRRAENTTCAAEPTAAWEGNFVRKIRYFAAERGFG